MLIYSSPQEYWNGLPFPPPGDLLNSEMEPASPALQADSLLLNHRGSPVLCCYCYLNSKTATFPLSLPHNFPPPHGTLHLSLCLQDSFWTLSSQDPAQKKWDESYFSGMVAWNISPLLFINFLKKKKKA